jgi:MoaA/NifB/PqqE/SkfB family radical SAM enzyme
MTIDQCLADLHQKFKVLDTVWCDQWNSNVDALLQIKALHRDVFENDQRIIFVITQDSSIPTAPGQNLQNLQSMINDVDISNFFICLVTTNPDVNQHYQTVLENHSQDSVPFHVYQCQGNYHEINDNRSKVFNKYNSIKNVAHHASQLSEKHKELLFHNKTFCMLPWTGINVEANNRVRPCCEFQQSIGDSSEHSLETIWNSSSWKQVRTKMLAGEHVAACDDCYQKESMGKDTLRLSANRLLIDQVDTVDQTEHDGHLDQFHLSYWDIRYNNLCNLACRSCGPNASSSWYQPAVDLGMIDSNRSPFLIAGRDNNDMFKQIARHMDHVKHIYFAGGEPSMIDKFYDILELLDAHGRNDVRLVYNMNMSRLNLKKRSLLDLWKRFPNVSIGASLDGEHQRGEYLRQGLIWKDVVDNRRMMQDSCPHVDFYVSATVSILNVLHLPDFHQSWVEQELIRPEEFNVNLLLTPKYLRADHSPRSMKNKIKQVYAKHLDWLMLNDSLGRATDGFRSVIRYIENDQEFDSAEFWNKIQQLDQYHGNSLIHCFPELSFLQGDKQPMDAQLI